MTIKLGLIGAGAIGGAVIEAIKAHTLLDYQLVGVFDVAMSDKARQNLEGTGIEIAPTIKSLMQLGPDLILEAAGHAAVAAYGAQILRSGIDFVPMSVGAFAEEDLFAELNLLAEQNNVRIYISSGAIGGLDVLRAAHARNDLEEVILTSTKKPAALAGQPYFEKHEINIEDIRERLIVFEGSARVACREFPKSTNIAASISLAGLGFDNTTVNMVADPDTHRTVHTLTARGAFGEMKMALQNYPHPDNPSTTYLACLGAIAALKNRNASVQFV